MRWASLRHGDADDQRGVRANIGRPGRARPRGRLLADADRPLQAHPDLLFMAEVYWDMEWTLQRRGFDLCYDKRLYDRLAHDPRASVAATWRPTPATRST
jgi:hypothetical protein